MGAIISLLIAIASIQCGASLAKVLFPMVGPIGTTTLRLFFSSIILFIVWKPWRRFPERKHWKHVIGYGASLGGMNLLFYMSLARIPLGIAVALEFTGPLVLALALSKRPRDLVWALCAVAGIILLLPLTESAAQLDLMGIFLALSAGACWACYIICGQRASNVIHGGTITALGMCVATAIVAPIGLFTTGTVLFNPSILPLGFAVAALSSSLPYSLEMVALKRMPAHTFSIFMSLEPAMAALSGFMFLNEKLTLTQFVAICLVIVASVGTSISNVKSKKSAPTQA